MMMFIFCFDLSFRSIHQLNELLTPTAGSSLYVSIDTHYVDLKTIQLACSQRS